MNAIVVIVGILVVGLIVWLAGRHQRGGVRKEVSERDRILQELQEIEKERQRAVDNAAQGRATISTDRALKQVEILKQAYVDSGQEEAAREIEQVIREFREQNGPEIPVDQAYALMKEIEGKHGP
jgi:hypothetical protein